MQPIVLVALLLLGLIVLAIRELFKDSSNNPIDLCPEMSASDVMLGLCLGALGIGIVFGLVLLAAYVMGYLQ